MLRKITTIILLLAILTGKVCAQTYDSQRTQVLLTNVISNALIGGIGGAINKNKNEKVYTAFIRNFLKGGVGGLVGYTAKYQTYYLSAESNAIYAPLNRLYYFLGNSIVRNASLNRKALETYYCNFYGIDFRLSMAKEQKIEARLSLATLGSAIYFTARGYELNLFKSLEYGQLLFTMKPGGAGIYPAMALFNSIVFASVSSRINYNILPHEIIHTYQAYDAFGISSFYDKQLKKKYGDKKIYSLVSKYIVVDYQALFMVGLYLPQFRPMPDYYKNYFEFEAEHFATRAYVKR